MSIQLRKAQKKNRPQQKHHIEFPLVASVCTLVLFGIVMVYSASSYNASINYGNEYYYMTKQIIGAVLGFCAMTGFYFIDYHKLEKWKNWILLLSFLLLVVVFIPGVGSTSYGATRWIKLPGFTIQPSEIAKFCFVIFTASYLAKNKDIVKSFKGILPVLFVLRWHWGNSPIHQSLQVYPFFLQFLKCFRK